jgi:spore germination protein YaaH
LPEAWKSVPLQSLDRLLFFQVTILPRGRLQTPEGWPEHWQEFLEAAQAQGKPVELTLSLLDRQHFNALFASPQAMRKLSDAAVELAQHPLISGLHLDVELYDAFPRTHQLAYQRFVRELAQRLHQLPQPRTLSAFVPLGGPMALYAPETLALLDGVVLQGYDAHWQSSAHAGPVAPLEGAEKSSWRQVLRQTDRWGLPRSKVFMGFPLYGYEWTVHRPSPQAAVLGRGDITTYSAVLPEWLPQIRINVQDRVQRYGAHYDRASGSAYYQFRDERGRLRVGWFEDENTLDRKIDFLQTEQLGGIAFFPLGYDAGQLVQRYAERTAPHALTEPND